MINKDFAKEQTPTNTRQIHQSDPRSQPILLPFLKLYSFVIGVGAIPVRLFFYKNIGERSISPLAWLISGVIHIYYIAIYAFAFSAVIALSLLWFYDSILELETLWNDLIEELGWFNTAFIFFNGVSIYFLRAFIIGGWRHFSSTAKKEKYISETGSYYRGDPILLSFRDYDEKSVWTFWGKKIVNKENFSIYVEPQRIILLGIIVTIFFSIVPMLILLFYDSLISSVIVVFLLSYNSVGVLMVLSSICLILEEKGIDRRKRYAALDLIDGEHDLKQVLKIRNSVFSPETKKRSYSLKEKRYPTVRIKS